MITHEPLNQIPIIFFSSPCLKPCTIFFIVILQHTDVHTVTFRGKCYHDQES